MSEDPKSAEAEKTEGAPSPEEEAALGAAKAKKKKKLIIIGALAGLLLIGGGGGGYYFMTKKAQEKSAAEAAAAETESKGKIAYYPLGDMIVNLSGEGKHPNYLKVKISLELADEKDVPLIDAIKPRIIDNFQVYLRQLRIDDLRGSAGLYRLREELLMRVTEAAQPVRIRDVLFQEMLVQ